MCGDALSVTSGNNFAYEEEDFLLLIWIRLLSEWTRWAAKRNGLPGGRPLR